MPRQLYGLGSLVKSVTKPFKKVAKGIKSFAGSDIGKLALTAGALYGLGGGTFFGKMLPGVTRGGQGFGGFGGLSSIFGNVGDIIGGKGLGDAFAKFGGSKLGGIAALTIPSVLAAAGVQEEEVEELQQDKGKLATLLERGYRNLNRNASDEEVQAFVRANVANGGRIGYAEGDLSKDKFYQKWAERYEQNPDSPLVTMHENYNKYKDFYERTKKANGGRIGFAMGDSAEDNAIQASGIMGLPLNKNPAGVTELDLRETGGFIPPVGVKEKADDIPAMLSNNEFVFTADAVRGMGGGDVDKGAERMYAMMKTLENGGRV